MANSFDEALEQVVGEILNEAPKGAAFSAQQVIERLLSFEKGRWYHEKLTQSKDFRGAHSQIGLAIEDLTDKLKIKKAQMNDSDLKLYTPKTINGSISASQLWIAQ